MEEVKDDKSEHKYEQLFDGMPDRISGVIREVLSTPGGPQMEMLVDALIRVVVAEYFLRVANTRPPLAALRGPVTLMTLQVLKESTLGLNTDSAERIESALKTILEDVKREVHPVEISVLFPGAPTENDELN